MTNKEAIEELSVIYERLSHPEDCDNGVYSFKDGDYLNALDLAIEALEQMDDLCENLAFYTNERQRLMKELEESKAKEGKGCLETAIENFGQLVSILNEALQGMTPEGIRELLRPDEEEEDHEEDRDTESE